MNSKKGFINYRLLRVGEARGHGYLSRREERFHEFSRIERVPERVSCGDVFTIATRDATLLVCGPYCYIPIGRKDPRTELLLNMRRRGMQRTTSIFKRWKTVDSLKLGNWKSYVLRWLLLKKGLTHH